MRAIAFFVCLMLIQPVSAQQATKFKGFFIGMSKKDVIALKPAGYTLKELPNAIGFTDPKSGFDFPSAIFNLDQDGLVMEFHLAKSYFGAAEMPGDQFIHAIVANYGVGQLSCKSKQTELERLNGVPKYIGSTECTGYSTNGELIRLTDSGLNVQRASQKPSFD